MNKGIWDTVTKLLNGQLCNDDYISEYCDNDVIATEAVWNARKADFLRAITDGKENR